MSRESDSEPLRSGSSSSGPSHEAREQHSEPNAPIAPTARCLVLPHDLSPRHPHAARRDEGPRDAPRSVECRCTTQGNMPAVATNPPPRCTGAWRPDGPPRHAGTTRQAPHRHTPPTASAAGLPPRIALTPTGQGPNPSTRANAEPARCRPQCSESHEKAEAVRTDRPKSERLTRSHRCT